MQTPLPTLGLIMLYLLFVYFAPKVMKNRAPLEMKPLLFVFNAAIVVLYIYLTREVRSYITSLWKSYKERAFEIQIIYPDLSIIGSVFMGCVYCYDNVAPHEQGFITNYYVGVTMRLIITTIRPYHCSHIQDM